MCLSEECELLLCDLCMSAVVTWLATYFTKRAFLAAGVEREAGEREGETGHRAVQRNNLPCRDKINVFVFISISPTHNARFGLGQLNRLVHLKAKAKSQGFQYVHVHAEAKDSR